MLGRLGCRWPTFIISIAPACSGMSVCIEWMKQMSSTHSADVREDVADPLAALAVLPEAVRRREQAVLRVAQRLAIDLGRALAGVLGDLRLVVERVDLRRPARHEELNDVLGLRGEVRQLGQQRRSDGAAVAACECSPASSDARPSVPKPAPIRDRAARGVKRGSVGSRWNMAGHSCVSFQIHQLAGAEQHLGILLPRRQPVRRSIGRLQELLAQAQLFVCHGPAITAASTPRSIRASSVGIASVARRAAQVPWPARS